MAGRKASGVAEVIQRATLADLLNKPKRSKVLTLGSGEPGATQTSIEFCALGAKAYDDLIAAHPPTKAQLAKGAMWNPDTFAPTLIAACSVDPVIDPESAAQIWVSEAWSRGELMDLFMSVVGLNSEGLDIPLSDSD